MSGAFAIPTVLLAGLVFLSLTRRAFDREESQWILACYVAHVVSAVAQVLITVEYYGGGDMTNYARWAAPLVRWLTVDPDGAWPEVLGLIFRRSTRIPFEVIGAGESTGAVTGVTAATFHLLGTSLYTACLVFSTLAFTGQVALYAAFRRLFADVPRRRVLLAALVVPSVVFWSSGVLKETFAMTGVGWMMLGLTELTERRLARAVMLLVPGALLCAIFKSYVLFPFLLAAGTYLYWRRAVERSAGRAIEIRPVSLVAVGGLVVGGVMLLGRLFPSYSLDSFAESTARLHRLGGQVGGGSYYSVGDLSRLGFWGQIAFAPLALVSALFRPFPFEIRNPLLLVNAIETTGLLLVAAHAISRQSWARIWERARSSPAQMMAIVFVAAFGAAVGLVTTNIGSLSRYRIPMMPFFVAVVAAWATRAETTEPSPETVPAPATLAGSRRLRAR